LPWELSDPSLCGSKDDVEEMLITLAVFKLVEPFARRSERLENDNYVNALSCQIVITYPAVTKKIVSD
jgi:hypothetical protein